MGCECDCVSILCVCVCVCVCARWGSLVSIFKYVCIPMGVCVWKEQPCVQFVTMSLHTDGCVCAENGPKTVKLFINQPTTLDFDRADSMAPVQQLELVFRLIPYLWSS